MTNKIVVKRATFLFSGDENDEQEDGAGGAVQISCECGFNGYVDCDTTHRTISGACGNCSTIFEVNR